MRTRKISDKAILEGLLKKYGKNKLINHISKITENHNNPSMKVDKEDYDFLARYPNEVFPFGDYINYLNNWIKNTEIPDTQISEFAKKRVENLESEYNSYLDKRAELEEKYGIDVVSNIISRHDGYSN